MPSKWPEGIEFKEIILKVEDNICKKCKSELIIRKDRVHCIYSLEGPIRLVCKLSCCSNIQCSERNTLISPESEISIAMPRWRIGWDLFLWMGFRRFKRHWSVPQILDELQDTYQISPSKNTVIKYLMKYLLMAAARHQDISRLQSEYKDCSDVILAIDGLQPEKGHETLYVVREIRKQRVWFAEPLLSSSCAEILKLIRRAKELAQKLNKPVCVWVSDKQDAFAASIAAEFQNVPHRYCDNHFLRDLARPVLEKDSHAKVQMRKKVRGLRGIEKEVLAESDKSPQKDNELNPEQKRFAINIVLDYCATVRGILNDNHGGPLNPSGLRMANALNEVSQSLERSLKHGVTPISAKLKRLNECIKRGLLIYERDKAKIEEYAGKIEKVSDTLNSKSGSVSIRLDRFRRLKTQFAKTDDPIYIHMKKVMNSFEPGLSAGSDHLDIPRDNLELERWFKKPKGHERRIHGHQHAGIRIVHEGATLIPALDAHLFLTEPVTFQDLLPYAEAKAPKCQTESIERNRIMRKAGSKKKDQLY